MKKLVVMLLTLAMILTLTACGGSKSSDGAASGAASGGADVSGIPEMEIKIAMAASETSDEGSNFQVLMDYVTEQTGGKITFKVYYDGSFCTAPEQWKYVKDGDIDLHYNLVAQNPQEFIIRQAFAQVKDRESVNDEFNYIVNENPETAAILEKDSEEHNIKLLGVWNSGASVYFSTKPLTSLDDLRGTSYGSEMGSEVIAALGVSTQVVPIVDAYEALSRGVINSSGGTLPALMNFKFYEVAKNILIAPIGSPSHQIEMNLDTWNALGEEAQKIFEEAVRLSEENNNALRIGGQDQIVAALEEQGCTVTDMSKEDVAEYLQAIYDLRYSTYGPLAEQAGKGDEFYTVLDAIAEYNGITINK